jgi:hypothetical protein
MISLMLFLPLAGRGGEKGRGSTEATAGSGGGQGPSACMMLWRGVIWSSTSCTPSGPWWIEMERDFKAGISIKRPRRLLSGEYLAYPLLSAGQGGEGEEGKGCGAAELWRWRLVQLSWRSFKSDRDSYMVALARHHDSRLKGQPLRVPWMACFQPPMWRPFTGFLPALNASAAPSGVVPGCGEGGRRWSPRSAGGGEGPDCFFCYLF